MNGKPMEVGMGGHGSCKAGAPVHGAWAEVAAGIGV